MRGKATKLFFLVGLILLGFIFLAIKNTYAGEETCQCGKNSVGNCNVDCEDVTVWFPGEGYDEYQTYNDCGGPADCNGQPCMGGQCGADVGGGGGDTCPIGYVKLCPQTVPVCDPNRK